MIEYDRETAMTTHIERYVGTTEEEVHSHKFNIWVGVSLGNKFFSETNLSAYIQWALKNTKEDMLIVIADRIQSINYEVFSEYRPKRAMSVALRKGQEMANLVEKIIAGYPPTQTRLVKTAKWEDVTNNNFYRDKAPLIRDEFQKNENFQNFLLHIVKENIGQRADTLTREQMKQLATYILDEMPVILNGVEYDEKKYTLHPYPSLSLLDDLFIGLQQKSLFPELAEKLDLKEKIAIVEVSIKT